MTDVKDRTGFITGGANGIGRGIARALAKAGARIAIVDLDETALDRAKAELSALTDVAVFKLDVRDRTEYARIADGVERKLGPVSLLFNNAGVAGGTAAAKMTYELWDWGIGINLIGVINGIQTFLPRMVERKSGGHIVNTASGAGLVEAGAGVLYHTAKFGVVGLSEALRTELAASAIGVSVLCPGPVATGIVDNTRRTQPGVDASAPLDSAVEQRLDASRRFLQRGVSPDAVGEMVLRAVRNNGLYIHTDRMVLPLIEARTKELLDAMPPAS
jgi:NAD(P)-dependent dehydrogenase (short-subunit alcohol dehydrogenase family)